MTTTESSLSEVALAFVEQVTADATQIFDVFRQSNTVSANRQANFVERIPGENLAVALNDPGPWSKDQTVYPVVASFDGTVQLGRGMAGFIKEFSPIFEAHPEISTVVHIHTPWLGGWAQTHRTVPIRYAASQRLTLSREIRPHINRRQSPSSFILEQLETDPHLAAIFEANGGINVVGRSGLLDTAKFILLLEEGAQFQAIGEFVGGSKEFDPTNLEAQWSLSGLLDEAHRLGLIPDTSPTR